MIRNRKLVRIVMAAFAALYLFTHFIPHAHAHDGIDHEGAGIVEQVTIGDLEITGAFARATLPNAPVGGGYMSIANTGATDDKLVGAASAIAGAVGLHQMQMVEDVMRMGEVPGGIAIPAGETVTLAPGGLHVMFMGINQPFIEGECVQMTLTFEVAGDVNLCLAIAGAAADAPMDHSGHGSMDAAE